MALEATRNFLCSYVQSLLQIRQEDDRDLVKGKSVIADEDVPKRTKLSKPINPEPWPPSMDGLVAVSVDGSFM